MYPTGCEGDSSPHALLISIYFVAVQPHETPHYDQSGEKVRLFQNHNQAYLFKNHLYNFECKKTGDI